MKQLVLHIDESLSTSSIDYENDMHNSIGDQLAKLKSVIVDIKLNNSSNRTSNKFLLTKTFIEDNFDWKTKLSTDRKDNSTPTTMKDSNVDKSNDSIFSGNKCREIAKSKSRRLPSKFYTRNPS